MWKVGVLSEVYIRVYMVGLNGNWYDSSCCGTGWCRTLWCRTLGCMRLIEPVRGYPHMTSDRAYIPVRDYPYMTSNIYL